MAAIILVSVDRQGILAANALTTVTYTCFAFRSVVTGIPTVSTLRWRQWEVAIKSERVRFGALSGSFVSQVRLVAGRSHMARTLSKPFMTHA
jgi:hypothetical protein